MKDTSTTRTRGRIATATVALATVVALATSGCAGNSGGDANTIDYWLWDSAQQPAYELCGDAFEAENPDLTINFVQYGWSDYWSKLTAGFIAGTGPDVFTDHLSKYPQFVDLEVLYPLDELEATKDISDSDFLPDLAALWKGKDGLRYGVPKDWDTVGYFYNRALTDAAGITDEQLSTMTWNPQDGGTFEQIIAHLTVDANGVRGDEPGFDNSRIATYGLAGTDSGFGTFGQGQWSAYTGSIDWEATDRNPWGTHFNFDDPNFQEVLDWYFGLAEKGYMAPYSVAGNPSAAFGGDKQLSAGTAAMAMNGSWMISTLTNLVDADGNPVDVAVAPTPIGPSGQRASMFNGLADSISRQADNPEAAAKWVAFLGSDECQRIVGESAVVFPARAAGTEAALAAHEQANFDATPFTIHVADGTTFPLPVTSNGADITAFLRPALDGIYLGETDASVMTETNDRINALLDLADQDK